MSQKIGKGERGVNKRRWIALAIIVVVVVAGIVASVATGGLDMAFGSSNGWEEEVISGSGHDRVAVITLDGAISESSAGGLLGDVIIFDDLMSQLQQALEDPAVRAVVLRVNSPGGEVVASDEIYRKIKEIQDNGKPVVVSMGTMAASGGYYVAAAANKIYANPNSLTGSIGVIFTLPNYQKLADLIGYKETVIQSGKMKDMGNPLREMRPDEKQVFQSLVDETYQRFVDLVAEERGLPREKVLTIADGRIYSGQQAKELGLVDELGTLEDAIEAAKELAGLEEALVIRYTYPPMSLLDFIGGFLGKPNHPSPLSSLEELLPFSQQPRLMYLFQP